MNDEIHQVHFFVGRRGEEGIQLCFAPALLLFFIFVCLLLADLFLSSMRSFIVLRLIDCELISCFYRNFSYFLFYIQLLRRFGVNRMGNHVFFLLLRQGEFSQLQLALSLPTYLRFPLFNFLLTYPQVLFSNRPKILLYLFSVLFLYLYLFIEFLPQSAIPPITVQISRITLFDILHPLILLFVLSR